MNDEATINQSFFNHMNDEATINQSFFVHVNDGTTINQLKINHMNDRSYERSFMIDGIFDQSHFSLCGRDSCNVFFLEGFWWSRGLVREGFELRSLRSVDW